MLITRDLHSDTNPSVFTKYKISFFQKSDDRRKAGFENSPRKKKRFYQHKNHCFGMMNYILPYCISIANIIRIIVISSLMCLRQILC